MAMSSGMVLSYGALPSSGMSAWRGPVAWNDSYQLRTSRGRRSGLLAKEGEGGGRSVGPNKRSMDP